MDAHGRRGVCFDPRVHVVHDGTPLPQTAVGRVPGTARTALPRHQGRPSTDLHRLQHQLRVLVLDHTWTEQRWDWLVPTMCATGSPRRPRTSTRSGRRARTEACWDTREWGLPTLRRRRSHQRTPLNLLSRCSPSLEAMRGRPTAFHPSSMRRRSADARTPCPPAPPSLLPHDLPPPERGNHVHHHISQLDHEGSQRAVCIPGLRDWK